MSGLRDEMGRLRFEFLRPGTRLAPTEERVRALEATLGCGLPEHYRAFLLDYGGCDFGSHLHCPSSPSREFAVFYGFYGDGSYDLAGELQPHRGRIPPDLLPIGEDQYTNMYCISFKGSRSGRIYFWEREREQEGDFDNVSLVSSDFVSFLKSLRPKQE